MKFIELTYRTYPVIITDKDIQILSVKLDTTEVLKHIQKFMETQDYKKVEKTLFFDDFFNRYHLETNELLKELKKEGTQK